MCFEGCYRECDRKVLMTGGKKVERWMSTELKARGVEAREKIYGGTNVGDASGVGEERQWDGSGTKFQVLLRCSCGLACG